MKNLHKVLTTTAVSAALASGIGFAQPGPQNQQGHAPAFGAQGMQHRGTTFGHKGGPRGFAFGMQQGGQGGFVIGMRGANNGPAQRNNHRNPLAMISRLNQGSTVTASFYDADPASGAVASSSLSLAVGVESEMTFMKSFRDLSETANYVVINVGPQTKTIELNKEDRPVGVLRRLGKDKVSVMLSHLDLNSTVQVSFYNANPSDGGAALTTLNFVAGQDSELAFKNAFEAAANNASWVTISVSAQQHTINLGEIREHRAEMQGLNGKPDFGPRFGPKQGHRGPGQ